MNDAPKKSLRSIALHGSGIEIAAYAASQLLRLASTLILSRLLFPEAFGLAALIAITNQGLGMLSDVGIEQCVIRSARGDDPRFLNTVWTMHLLRGVGLWVAACLIAWPMAHFYSEPSLLYLIPVGSLNVLIACAASTSLFTLRRDLRLWLLNGIDLASQMASLVVVVASAYVWNSVWAIVAGGLAAALTRTIWSYFIDVGYRNRPGWDRATRDEIFSFGKWIFGSSALAFVGTQGDRLMLARFIGMGPLGVYSIAVYLSDAVGALVSRITGGVLYPILSQLARDSPDRIRSAYYKTRLRLDLLSLTSLGALLGLAQTVVDILYDERYSDAGWMLQPLCIRVAMACMLGQCETCLNSLGHTRYGFYRAIGQTVWVFIGVPIGWAYWGVEGVIWAVALTHVPAMVLLWLPFHSLGLLRLSRELLAVAFFVVGAIGGHLASPYVNAIAEHFS